MFVAVLFFRTIRTDVGEGRTTVGDALNQLEGTAGGEAVLFLMGGSHLWPPSFKASCF